MKRNSRELHHLKSSKVNVGTGHPSPHEGSSGDMTLRMTRTGLKLFVKFSNTWYVIGEGNLYQLGGETSDELFDSNRKKVVNTKNILRSIKGDTERAENLKLNAKKGNLELEPSGGNVYIYDGAPRLLHPALLIVNETDDATAGFLYFKVDRDGKGTTGGQDDDTLGTIVWTGYNDDPTSMTFANIVTQIVDATDGSEKGKLQINVLTSGASNAGLDAGLILTGSSTNDEVDVTIGNGADSLTTIAGNIDIDGDTITTAGALKLDTAGDLTLDANSGIFHFQDAADADDAFKITVAGGTGATTLETVSADGDGDLTLDIAGDLTVDVAGGVMTVTDNTAGDPQLIIKSTNSSTNLGPSLALECDEGNANETNDILGNIYFIGQNDATSGPTRYTFASIKASVSDPTDNGEIGQLELQALTESASGNVGVTGLKLTGSSTNDEVDVTIGAGADSLTTIAGNIDIDGDTITTAGNISLDSAGTITLDSHNGNFIAKKAGTEFSAANSAYAGMILGATEITYSTGQFYATTTSHANVMKNFDSEDHYLKVSFVVPPSNRVKIKVFLPYCSACDGTLELGLATDTSATALDTKYNHFVWDADETDSVMINQEWNINGADHSWSAGESKTLYCTAKEGTAGGRLFFGKGVGTTYYGSWIMEAIALPTTIADGT